MNKEIKFRGRSPLAKQWEYGFLITVDLSSEKLSKNLSAIIKENAWYEPSEGIGEFKLVEPETVGQFTGLIDKNGKQIYEGDIVCWNEYTMKIVWGDIIGYGFGFMWEMCGTNTTWNESITGFIDEYEIIGNIHDHPELLVNKDV